MRDTGLVLCGGGGRGAYQIGAWRALEEQGYISRIAAVSGTSVGALNAALFVSKTQSQAEKIWCSIRQEDLTDFNEIRSIFDKKRFVDSMTTSIKDSIFNMLDNAMNRKGIFSREGLKNIIESNDICGGVLRSQLPVYACYRRADNGDVVYKDMRDCNSEDDVLDILFASSSIPVIFQMQKYDSKYNVDGGFFGDNTPVEPLYNMGIRKFIVIALNPKEEFSLEMKYRDAEFTLIKPTYDIYLDYNGDTILTDGTIDFNGKNAARRIILGYNETIAHLKWAVPKLSAFSGIFGAVSPVNKKPESDSDKKFREIQADIDARNQEIKNETDRKLRAAENDFSSMNQIYKNFFK